MLRPLIVSGFALGLLWHGNAFASSCDNSYEKTIPYKQPIVDKLGKVSLDNLITLRYDCNVFLAEASGGLEVGFFGSQARVIDGKVSADTNGGGANLSASALVMGYEIAHQEVRLGTVYRHTFRPDHDIDLSQTTLLQIGPVPVPVRYGISGTTELDVDAGFRNFGTEIAATPRAHANGYVQSSVDLEIIYGEARGQLLLADASLRNTIGVRFSPNAQQPSIKFDAVGDAAVDALKGSVKARLTKKIGNSNKDYEKTLAEWNGVNSKLKMYAESGKIVDLPAAAVKAAKAGQAPSK